MAEINKRNIKAVKTPIRKTEKVEITNIVQQGEILGPILCPNSIAEA